MAEALLDEMMDIPSVQTVRGGQVDVDTPNVFMHLHFPVERSICTSLTVSKTLLYKNSIIWDIVQRYRKKRKKLRMCWLMWLISWWRNLFRQTTPMTSPCQGTERFGPPKWLRPEPTWAQHMRSESQRTSPTSRNVETKTSVSPLSKSGIGDSNIISYT